MRLLLLILGLLGNLFFPLFAANLNSTQPRVIYVTLDGVRWQDIYLDKTHFPLLWEKHANKLTFYGMPNTNSRIHVASIPISLPSYQSQMAGQIQPCFSNSCGRITVETLAENLIHDFGLQKKEVATFASWWHIGLAVEHIPETTYVNVGNFPVVDPGTGEPDEIMAVLNIQQQIDRPDIERYPLSRYDKYTYAHAIHYLEKFQPRFLWISFVDADEAAHVNDLAYYHRMLDYYDWVLDDLFMKLKALQLDKNTMVIVTTDHGRGDGSNWTEHGPKYLESWRTFAFVLNGDLIPYAERHGVSFYSTLSIRPTIERYFSRPAV